MIGFALTQRLLPDRLALLAAPVLGWAVHSVAMFWIFCATGMSRWGVGAGFLIPFVATLPLVVRGPRANPDFVPGRMVLFALSGALGLAAVSVLGVIPKVSLDGVALAPPIFDHAKVAIIDEIRRSGVPGTNPFFFETGFQTRLSYYYLWHFSAAELSLLLSYTGWEADAGLTLFTTFAALSLMIGLSAWLARSARATFWVVVLAAAGSAGTLLTWLVGWRAAYAVMGWPTGFGGLLFQAAWAPQHVLSAAAVVLAAILMIRVAIRPSITLIVVLSVVVSAAYMSSVWVGGVTFAIAALVMAPMILARTAPDLRFRFAISMILAAVLAVALSWPFLSAQYEMNVIREAGLPIDIELFSFLDPKLTGHVGSLLELPAFWLIFLPLMFPAIYPAGCVALISMSRDRSAGAEQRTGIFVFCALVICSLAASWLLVSTIARNNDLGWRAILPALMLLTVFAATGLARWIQRPLTWAALLSLTALAVGLPNSISFVRSNLLIVSSPSAQIFATSPAMWEAVKRHSSVTDRIANNPLWLSDMTSWPVNISWALLADRRSCYAGAELALAFAPVPPARRKLIDAQFIRIFAGEAEERDISDLIQRFGCDLIVLTRQDGAWVRDPFSQSPIFSLVEERPGEWRIYRAVKVG